MTTALTIDQAKDIADLIAYRQASFANETLETSIMVALLNAGDRFTSVACVAGEWTGTKGDLQRGAGIPKCPNGHVLLEGDQRKRLGYIDEA